MGTAILLAITTSIGYFIGHNYVTEHEILITIVGFVIGLLMRFGSADSISSGVDDFSGIDFGD